MSDPDKSGKDDYQSRRKHRLARLDLLSEFADNMSTPAPVKPEALPSTPKPALSLEAALRENELHKTELKKYVAAMAPELQKRYELQAKLDTLPQLQRRRVLDAMGLKHISAVPPPLEPPKNSGCNKPPTPTVVSATSQPTVKAVTSKRDNHPQAAPVQAAPVVTHSTKGTRADALTSVIKCAQGKCENPNDAAQVWTQLEKLAGETYGPLIQMTQGGLTYSEGGEVKTINRAAIAKRIKRAAA